ncbi:hypothetical protein [Streptomyces brasiliensis]|uniref:ABC transporter ATP-binding protein n=1 Tax=Streptomyces brasiliensis TaxID=1954 RepID=A0A917PDX9_9ACTN|nr:hypothetical protein [Streptomyces brasiliensis]GGJ72051.1 hypothetical protein GCM10010121_098240 [Streptomyces brasiliensis]
MEFVAELNVGVILSSHLLGNLERVCDHMIILASSRVQLAGDVDNLLATHYRLIGTPADLDDLPPGSDVIQAERASRQATLIVRTNEPLPATLPDAEHIDLEDLVLAYMTRAANQAVSGTAPEPQEAHR